MITFEEHVFDFEHKTADPLEDALERHMHNGYEILYVVQGEGDYVIEGTTYRIVPHTLLLIRPRRFHYLRLHGDATYERFVIHFPEDRIPESLRERVTALPEIFHPVRGGVADAFFRTWCEAEQHYGDADTALCLLHTFPSLLLALCHLPRDGEIASRCENPTLDAILRYIDEHPAEPITAAALAARFFASTSFIVHGFRRYLGVSLMQYVNRKRVLYAESLIRAGESPTAVAKSCHYDSYVTFYRQFKKHLGYSPARGK